MTQQTMLEISNPFDCYVKGLGEGVAMFMFIGCITANPSFLVKIYSDGIMRVVDIMDMALYGNPQYGEALEPPTIKKWKGIKPESEIPKGNRHLMNRVKSQMKKSKTNHQNVHKQIKIQQGLPYCKRGGS